MPIALTDAHHEWTASLLGVDPRSYGAAEAAPPTASAGEGGFLDAASKAVTYAAMSAENAARDVWSETKIAAEAAQQAAAGIADKEREAAEDAAEAASRAPGPAPPPGSPPAGPITLTSQTEASQPSNRARTKLGVGERVTLTVSPGPGNWHASGAKLSARNGTTVTLTAPPRPGDVEVTVDVSGTTRTLKFTVVAPSVVRQEVKKTEHYNLGLPNAGFFAQVYVGPDDVNFSAVTFTEDEIGCKASGSWSQKNGEGHSPNPAPIGFTNKVVSGKGTMSFATDHCWSGYIPGLKLTDWTGEMSLSIPWHWQCGSGRGLITRVVQRVVTTSDGTTTISKAGASYTAALS